MGDSYVVFGYIVVYGTLFAYGIALYVRSRRLDKQSTER
jgi:hypothetical protein